MPKYRYRLFDMILAIDTSSSIPQVACAAFDKIYTQNASCHGKSNEEIIGMIQHVLQQAGITAAELAHIAVTVGPGSFTGVRLGVSIVQGIAAGSEIPVIPISTLELLGYQMYCESNCARYIVGLDARKGEIYWATFVRNSNSTLGYSYECCDSVSAFKDIKLDTLHHCYGEIWQSYVTQEYPHYKLLQNITTQKVQVEALLNLAQLKQSQAVHYLDISPIYVRNQVV